jgi:hypothetical protein
MCAIAVDENGTKLLTKEAIKSKAKRYIPDPKCGEEKVAIWKCGGPLCGGENEKGDRHCQINAMEGGPGREAFVKSMHCYNSNNGETMGQWHRLNVDLCTGDQALWTDYITDNKGTAAAGLHGTGCNKDIGRRCLEGNRKTPNLAK